MQVKSKKSGSSRPPGVVSSSPVRFFGAVCWMPLLDVCAPGSPELIRSGSGSRASGCRVFSD